MASPVFSINDIFKSDKLESDSGKTEAQKATVKQNALRLVDILNRLNAALEEAGIPSFTISSGYRSYDHQKRLYDAPHTQAVAKPGTSAHEFGSAVDIVCKSRNTVGMHGKMVTFIMKWFEDNNETFDQLIDESGSSSNHNGWLHMGITRQYETTNNRKQFVIAHGSSKVFAKTAKDWVDARNKDANETNSLTNTAGAGGPASASSIDSSNGSGSATTYKYTDEHGAVREMTAEEIAEAKRQYEEELYNSYIDAQNDAFAELAMLEANSNFYGDYTEDEIAELELAHELEFNDISEEDYYVAPDPLSAKAIIPETDNSSIANAISSATDNQSDVVVEDGNDEQKKEEHTRIYQYSKPTILLDELSLTKTGENAKIIDETTGQHETTSMYDNPNDNSKPGSTVGKAYAANMTSTLGYITPLIRIKDRFLGFNDIIKFKIINREFVPRMILEIRTQTNEFLKEEMIVDGTKVSVFFQSNNDSIKSYRADYRVSNVIVKPLNINDPGVHMIIYGYLDIPNLYNGANTFSFAGTSRDALMNISEKLGLGFNFCDPDNTNDSQMWYCINTGKREDPNEAPAIKYMMNVAYHSYKDENSFYDAWIDERYNLNFININKMLGEDGLDEKVDMAYYTLAKSSLSADSPQNLDLTAEQKKNRPRMIPKLLHNLKDDGNDLAPFYVKTIEEKISNLPTRLLGMYHSDNINIDNIAVDKTQNQIDFKYSICVNKTKLDNGFFIFGGPGKDSTYLQANNGDYAEQNTNKSGGWKQNMQADEDGNAIATSGNNMSASGNNNKMYEVGFNHNYRNNMWLSKKTLKVDLSGCNLQLMRGEKIPMLIRDVAGRFNMGAQEYEALNMVKEEYCGWFIIKNIEWEYDINMYGSTKWTTHLTLTRREWPIPGWTAESKVDESAIVVNQDINGSSVESSIDTSTGNNGEMTTAGLNTDLINIWNLLKDAATGKNYKLILSSGRRYFADENNNKLTHPGVKDGNLYKFINTHGDIVWYESATSPHNYGNAIDVVNGEGTTFKDVMTLIISTPDILAEMLFDGVYCTIEMSRDDMGNTVKHYHLGKIDNNDSNTLDAQSTWWRNVIINLGSKTIVNSQGIICELNTYTLYNDYTNDDLETFETEESMTPEDEMKMLMANSEYDNVDDAIDMATDLMNATKITLSVSNAGFYSYSSNDSGNQTTYYIEDVLLIAVGRDKSEAEQMASKLADSYISKAMNMGVGYVIANNYPTYDKATTTCKILISKSEQTQVIYAGNSENDNSKHVEINQNTTNNSNENINQPADTSSNEEPKKPTYGEWISKWAFDNYWDIAISDLENAVNQLATDLNVKDCFTFTWLMNTPRYDIDLNTCTITSSKFYMPNVYKVEVPAGILAKTELPDNIKSDDVLTYGDVIDIIPEEIEELAQFRNLTNTTTDTLYRKFAQDFAAATQNNEYIS